MNDFDSEWFIYFFYDKNIKRIADWGETIVINRFFVVSIACKNVTELNISF